MCYDDPDLLEIDVVGDYEDPEEDIFEGDEDDLDLHPPSIVMGCCQLQDTINNLEELKDRIEDQGEQSVIESAIEVLKCKLASCTYEDQI